MNTGKVPRSKEVKNLDVRRDFIKIGGPCSIESEQQMIQIAADMKKMGANVLRGGAFKPRTSPYSFQGLEQEGLKYLKKAGDMTGLPTVTEVMDTRDIEMVSRYSDILQVGARNMQNYSLLKELGRAKVPVLLKRGMGCTIEELIYSAEYILKEGNYKVILCERGIRTIETWTRNTLDISAVSLIKQLTDLPIITDPSHATGKRELIEPMCLASVMAGCDGLMIEVHEDPDKAVSDGHQSITPKQFKDIMEKVEMAKKLRKEIA
jgi:3-deoxy-7-phosphoheptulonate synthase